MGTKVGIKGVNMRGRMRRAARTHNCNQHQFKVVGLCVMVSKKERGL